MDRSLKLPITKDLPNKLILLSGPRQSGKTTLAKSLDTKHVYLNYDNLEHRLQLTRKQWQRDAPLLILDELHKMPRWKQWLKGIYDTEGLNPPIIVTGSAKLDTYRKVGDSLAGRYFPFRLHPLDIKELNANTLATHSELKSHFELLMQVGGFPEPFLKGSDSYYKRWKRTHVDIMLRQDLIDTERVHDITQIETLIQLLRERIGSPLSIASLARDLSVHDQTVSRWLKILERLYIVFRIRPYAKNVARAISKAPKIYFYDIAQVRGGTGPRFENLVAAALHKELHYRLDVLGEEWSLRYVRNRAGNEVDFLLLHDEIPNTLIEVKYSQTTIDSSLRTFRGYFKGIKTIQLVAQLSQSQSTEDGIRIEDAPEWLNTMPF